MEAPLTEFPKLPRCPAPEGWLALPLGTTFDETIARDLRARGLAVGRSTITRARQALGIATFVPPPAPRKQRARRRINWKSLPLGIIFDTLLAFHLGITHPCVLQHRRALGIPPAPRSLANSLLGAVQRRPGLRISSYAAHLDANLDNTILELVNLGLLKIAGNSLEPVIRPTHRRPKSFRNSPDRVSETPNPDLRVSGSTFEAPREG
jgi:hypothetical protein